MTNVNGRGYGHAKLRHFLPHFGVQVQNIDRKPRRGPLITSQIRKKLAQRLGRLGVTRWTLKAVLQMWTSLIESVPISQNPPAPKVLGRDLPDGTRKKVTGLPGGGHFSSKTSCF